MSTNTMPQVKIAVLNLCHRLKPKKYTANTLQNHLQSIYMSFVSNLILFTTVS